MNNPDIYVQCVFNHEWGINLIFALYINQSTQTERHTHTQNEITYTRTYMFTTVTFKMSHMSHTNISLYQYCYLRRPQFPQNHDMTLSQSDNHVLEDALGTCHCLWLVRCLVHTCKVLHLPKRRGMFRFFWLTRC